MIRSVAIVSLSSGIIGEPSVRFEVEIGLRRLKEYGLSVMFTSKGILDSWLKTMPDKNLSKVKIYCDICGYEHGCHYDRYGVAFSHDRKNEADDVDGDDQHHRYYCQHSFCRGYLFFFFFVIFHLIFPYGKIFLMTRPRGDRAGPLLYDRS